MNERTLNRDSIKRVNRNLVLNLVKSAGPISRRDISQRAGLSAATVSNLTVEFISEDLIREVGPGEAVRGRPPVLLRLNSRAGFVAGVKVMEDSLTAVVTDLDAEVLAYRTHPLEHGHDRDHFCVVTVGSGVGLGIVVAGGGAGELGHTTLVEDGPECYCGKKGCLEMLASDRALLRKATSMLPGLGRRGEKLALADIVNAAEAGDQPARHLLAESGHWLGVGVANVVNLLNPGLVIIGGEGVHAGEWRFGPMRQAFGSRLPDRLWSSTRHSLWARHSFSDRSWGRGWSTIATNRRSTTTSNAIDVQTETHRDSARRGAQSC